jgi:hypothetical protein
MSFEKLNCRRLILFNASNSLKEESQFHIPLCRMVFMPLVHPTLANDIKRLEVEFTHGYQPRAPVFYVSICNDKEEERFVKDEDTSN